MVMRRSLLSAVSAAVVGLGLATLRCTSVLGIGGGSITAEPCTGDTCAPCTTYCNLINQHCGFAPGGSHNVNGEYLDTDVCLRTCSASYNNWTQSSTPDDISTFQCRLNAAASNSCANAGPLGGTSCVQSATDPCTTFCTIEVPLCLDAGIVEYSSFDACMSYCGTTRNGWYVVPDGGTGDLVSHEEPTGDDTLNCRFWHLENALDQEPGFGYGPMPHCYHTGMTGPTTQLCVPQDAGTE
jgi:hypothetical protein